MKLFEGKKGLILGVANDRSIAWAIAREIMAHGGTCGFSHLPDKPEDEKKKNRMRVSKCTVEFPTQTAFLEPLDVQDDVQVNEFMKMAGEKLGKIDFLLHSIAFADRDDLSRRFQVSHGCERLQPDFRDECSSADLQSRCIGIGHDVFWR